MVSHVNTNVLSNRYRLRIMYPNLSNPPEAQHENHTEVRKKLKSRVVTTMHVDGA